jgi:hypothetical protein
MRLIGVELFHADGQTDMKKLTVANRSFSSAPKIITQCTPCNLNNARLLQKSSEIKAYCADKTQFKTSNRWHVQ